MDLLDRQRLDRLAQELTDGAGQLRSAVATIRSQAAALTWQSPAAGACARSLELTLAGVLRLAGSLDDTAARAVDHGQRAYALAERAAVTGVAMARHGVHLAERLVGR